MYQNIYFENKTQKVHIWDDQKGYFVTPYKKYAYIDALSPEMKNIAEKYIKTYENLPNKDRSLKENIRQIWEQLVVLRDQKGKLEPDPQVAKGLVTQKKGGMIQSSLASVDEVLNGIY